MPSAIDPTKPVDGVPAVKSDLRSNLLAAKTEIEALQAASGIVLNQHEVMGRVAAGSGPAAGLEPTDLATELTPATGDFLLGWTAGALRKFDVGTLPTGSGGDPAGVDIISLASADYDVPVDAPAHLRFSAQPDSSRKVFLGGTPTSQAKLRLVENIDPTWIFALHRGTVAAPGDLITNVQPRTIVLSGWDGAEWEGSARFISLEYLQSRPEVAAELTDKIWFLDSDGFLKLIAISSLPFSGGEAVPRTFAGTLVPDVPSVNYATFNQSGAQSFTKGAGAFDGSTHHLPFNSNGAALTWNAGFRSVSGSLPATLTTGLWDIIFTYHEARNEFLVAFPALIASQVDATPHGAIIGTNVMAQLQELESEKLAKVAAGAVLSDAELKDYSETSPADTGFGGAETVDYSAGQVVAVTLTSNVASLAISNPPATGKAGAITFIINHGTGPFTWAHPAGIRWPGGVAPTLSSGANDVDILTYVTRDAGTTWYGFVGGIDFS